MLGPASAAPGPRYEARYPKVVAMLGLDAFQIDYGVVAAAAVLAVDGHTQLLADDTTNGADLGWLGGPAAGHARSIAG